MSSNKQPAKSQDVVPVKGQQGTNPKGGYTKKEKVETTPVDRPISLGGRLVKDSVVTDAGIVAFFAADTKEALATYVVSRPVGKTLDPKSETWVINKVGDIPDLKIRVKNPRIERIEKAREVFILERLVEEDYLKKTPIGDHIVTVKLDKTNEGVNYHTWKRRAFELADREREKAKLTHDEGQKGRPPGLRKKFVWTKKSSSFYNPQEEHLQMAIEATIASLDLEVKARIMYPDDHITRVDGERDQEVLNPTGLDWGDLKSPQMMNEFHHAFWKFSSGKLVKDENITKMRDANLLLKRELVEAKLMIERLKLTFARDEIVAGLNLELVKAKDEILELRSNYGEALENLRDIKEELDNLHRLIDEEEHTPAGGD